MKLSQWRPAFKRFMAKHIQIEGYGVSEPDQYDIFLAHMPPLRDVKLTRSPPDIVNGVAYQDLWLLARYPGSTPYNELPIGFLEGLYANLVIHLELEHGSLDDAANPGVPLLQGLSTQQVETPVKVSELSYANQDWLAEVHLIIRIDFNAQPETPIPTILLNGMDLEVYRSTLRDLEDATLDWRIVL